MSAHQMVCHLSDSLRMASGYKAVRPTTSLLPRTVVKWFALYLPLPWPAGIPTSREIDQELGGTRPVAFESDVAELVALLDFIGAPNSSFERLHPVFGTMSYAAWLRWGYLHMDHHLRQFGV